MIPPGTTPDTAAPQPLRHRALLDRIVADSGDRVAWHRARSRAVTATDAAKLSTEASIESALKAKSSPSRFGNSAYLDHGRAREPVIARWVAHEHAIAANSALFRAESTDRHLATPDGLAWHDDALVLCEIKTTTTAWRSIPRHYLRQVWWQQYVLGAERTLVVWEQHDNFVPVASEPRWRWVDRDESEIHALIQRADTLLARMDSLRDPRAAPAVTIR